MNRYVFIVGYSIIILILQLINMLSCNWCIIKIMSIVDCSKHKFLFIYLFILIITPIIGLFFFG